MSESKQKICILNYSTGNYQSILKAISKFDCKVIISNDKNEIKSSDKLILPGVGSFKNTLNYIFLNNLDASISDFFLSGKPILGICLGMQILFESGEEGGISKGLNFIKGTVKKLPTNRNIKCPNIGWNKIIFKRDQKESFFNGVSDKDFFYFVHSYYIETNDKDLTIYKSKINNFIFPSVIIYKNLYSTQFHPEKSSKSGLIILKNFLDL